MVERVWTACSLMKYILIGDKQVNLYLFTVQCQKLPRCVNCKQEGLSVEGRPPACQQVSGWGWWASPSEQVYSVIRSSGWGGVPKWTTLNITFLLRTPHPQLAVDIQSDMTNNNQQQQWPKMMLPKRNQGLLQKWSNFMLSFWIP